MTEASDGPEPRRIGLPLMIAIYMYPPIFCWFLLRRGHAGSTRVAAFTYAGVTVAVGVLGVVAEVYPAG